MHRSVDVDLSHRTYFIRDLRMHCCVILVKMLKRLENPSM